MQKSFARESGAGFALCENNYRPTYPDAAQFCAVGAAHHFDGQTADHFSTYPIGLEQLKYRDSETTADNLPRYAMAKFLNTSATNYYLEELIKGAKDRLILISPFLRLNDRIKELLEDKNRLKIDVRIVYGKSELQPEEVNWLKGLAYVRTSFCKNLHAKCYLNEELCIVTSLNLYEFSQVNNNEMGILINRADDSALYKDAYEEAQRIIRISDEIRISLEVVAKEGEESDAEEGKDSAKIASSKIAQKMGMKTPEFLEKLLATGFLELRDGKHHLTAKGKDSGGEFRSSSRFGPYFLWPEEFRP